MDSKFNITTNSIQMSELLSKSKLPADFGYECKDVPWKESLWVKETMKIAERVTSKFKENDEQDVLVATEVVKTMKFLAASDFNDVHANIKINVPTPMNKILNRAANVGFNLLKSASDSFKAGNEVFAGTYTMLNWADRTNGNAGNLRYIKKKNLITIGTELFKGDESGKDFVTSLKNVLGVKNASAFVTLHEFAHGVEFTRNEEKNVGNNLFRELEVVLEELSEPMGDSRVRWGLRTAGLEDNKFLELNHDASQGLRTIGREMYADTMALLLLRNKIFTEGHGAAWELNQTKILNGLVKARHEEHIHKTSPMNYWNGRDHYSAPALSELEGLLKDKRGVLSKEEILEITNQAMNKGIAKVMLVGQETTGLSKHLATVLHVKERFDLLYHHYQKPIVRYDETILENFNKELRSVAGEEWCEKFDALKNDFDALDFDSWLGQSDNVMWTGCCYSFEEGKKNLDEIRNKEISTTKKIEEALAIEQPQELNLNITTKVKGTVGPQTPKLYS